MTLSDKTEAEQGDSKQPRAARKARAGQVDTRCGMCGSTAIDHTEYDCKFNRNIATPQDLFNKIVRVDNNRTSACMHDNCPSCHGTGRGPMGACIHMMSCPCPKCSPRMMMQVTT